MVNMDDAPLSVPRQPYTVRVLHLPAGDALPLGSARNRAAAIAQYRLLLFIDIDCIVGAACIGAVRETLQWRDCILCPDVLYLPDRYPVRVWHEADLRRRSQRHPARNFPVMGLTRAWNPGFLWSVAFAVRASTFYGLGGFDERFSGYGAEDTDLGFKANDYGLELIYRTGAPVFHQHHTLSQPPLHHFADIVRNASLFHDKWGIWPMQDRLDGFAAAGLLERGATELRILRYPTGAEIRAARQPDTVLF